MRALMVDQDAAYKKAARRALGAREWIVDMAGSAAEARTAFAARAFDVILVDYNLPDTTGVRLLREIRRARIAARVVGVSGSKTADLEGLFLKAGADAFFEKRELVAEDMDQALRRIVNGNGGAKADPKPTEEDLVPR